MFVTSRWIKPITVTLAVVLVSLSGCNSPKVLLKQFDVTIDYIPSPEYYGFFYARAQGYYKDVGLNVNIHNGTGAPAVARQIRSGGIYAGTTTSDNLLREMAAGANVSEAVPLLRFNPCVLASPATAALREIRDVVGKRIGTNKATSVYIQFKYLLAARNISLASITEVPAGYGGAELVATRDVDGFLAYTTNAVIDLQLQSPPITPHEVHFGDLGLESYGVVLVLSRAAGQKLANMSDAEFAAFAKATVRGYIEGAKDVSGAARALRDIAPTIDPHKAELAIKKIEALNKSTNYDPNRLDQWVPNIRPPTRQAFRQLWNREP